MKTELIVLLAAALALSGFGMYKQFTLVRSIGTIEFRWQTRAAKIRFAVTMMIYLVCFGAVLYRTVEPLIITAFIALLPIFLYRPLGYEYIGQDGLLVRGGSLRLHWHQVKSWEIVQEEGRASLRVEFLREAPGSKEEAAEIVFPKDRRSEIELAMQKWAVPVG